MPEYVMTEEELNAAFARERHLAAPIFEDCPCYPVEDIVELVKLQHGVWQEKDLAERARKLEAFVAKRNAMKPKADAPQKVYLWPEGRVPTYSMYFRNEDYRYNRDPGFEPYLYELLLPEDVTPKGAVLGTLAFGLADALSIYFRTGTTAVPTELIIALPYILTIVLTIFRSNFRVPAKLGVPYRKEG